MKHNVWTKVLSLLLALTLAVGTLPLPALAAGAAEDREAALQPLVSSVAELYDGDEERAKAELDTMYEAGLIQDDGSMVELDVKEDGESADLTALALRISAGEEVGAITVNGVDTPAEQVLQLEQVRSQLELARMLREDVEITDAHVANLESLLSGLADGSANLGGALETGRDYLSATSQVEALALLMADEDTVIDSGNLDLTGDTYTGPYVNGSVYEPNHSFTLADPAHTTWYRDSRTGGAGGDAVITLSCDQESISPEDGKLTVKATLDKPSPVPVTLDYKFSCGLRNRYHGSYYTISTGQEKPSGAQYNGTLTWAPGESGEKTIEVSALRYMYNDVHQTWTGSLGLLFSASNPQNAVLAGSADAWNHFAYYDSTEYYYLSHDYNNASGTTTNEIPSSTGFHGYLVPPATYHSGEIVPIIVTFNGPVRVDDTTRLTVNGVSCPVIGKPGLQAWTATFGYTVRDIETGSLNITAIEHLKKWSRTDAVPPDEEMPITGFQPKSIGAAEGVYLASKVKRNTLDRANAKWGVDDGGFGEQIATVVIPLKGTDSEKAWLASEAVDFSAQVGSGLQMELPGFEGVQFVRQYLSSAYFSYDNGKTRYPAYLVGEGSAIATRFAVPAIVAEQVRQDGVGFYLNQASLGESEAEKYMGAFSDWQKDARDFYFFTPAADAPAAGLLNGYVFSYYVKDAVPFTSDQFTLRQQSYEPAENGFIKLNNGSYVLLHDPDHPENQYDVEVVVSDQLYTAIGNGGFSAGDGGDIGISYQISDRKTNFTLTDPKWFVWNSSNEKVIAFNLENGDSSRAEVVLTGTQSQNPVTLSLKVTNGAPADGENAFTYTLPVCALPVAAGMSPFLTVPKSSRNRTTLTNTETDIFFSSNLTERNAAAGNKTTTFSMSLYAVDAVGAEIPEGAAAVWTSSADSTYENEWFNNIVSHFTVPDTVLSETGVYAAVISAAYMTGENGGETSQKLYSATAYLTVKQGPAKITLNRLDSYSAMDTAIPAIGYTVSPASAKVLYTIQAPGAAVSEKRVPEQNGVIPFSASTPQGLKDVYIITVYARNEAEDPWSVDSMMLTVYNHDALDLIVSDVATAAIGGTTGGVGESARNTTVTMYNDAKARSYLDEGATGGALSFTDLTALRTDISLQKVISANYGSGTWGAISDKMKWASDNPDAISVDYKQGGIYSDLRDYAYTSYTPATDFLIVGKDDATATVTATHAATNMTASLTVEAKTLTDRLYVFQFYPKAVTSVSYDNGAGETRLLSSNAEGQLAVYEPEGIPGGVMALSKSGGETYVGTVYPNALKSGERDVAALQLYPCNNLELRAISSLTLTFLKPDGSAYSGPVTLRGGVYKNGVYCPDAMLRTGTADAGAQSGRTDISATVTEGRLNLWFDPDQFGTPEDSDGLTAGDTVTYVLEYRLEDYQTGYALIHAAADAAGDADLAESVIQLQNFRGPAGVPQITRQTLQQYHGDRPNGYTRNVIDFTENLGISKEFDKVTLTTDVALMGERVEADASGYSAYAGADVVRFTLQTADGEALAGQSAAQDTAEQILDLSTLDSAGLYVFPFSSVPMLRSVYTMTAQTLSQNGITGYESTARIKAVFRRGAMTVRTENLPYGIANLTSLPDPKNDTTAIGSEITEDIEQQLDLGSAFKNIDVNEMLQKGFAFLGNLKRTSSPNAPGIMILPTENPEVFRIIAFVGYNKRGDEQDGLSVNYDPDELYEDTEKFKEAVEEMGKQDDGGDSGGEGSLKFNFYGTIILETGWNRQENRWQIDFIGGNVGANVKGSYGWSQTFMCGPYPFMISLDLGFHADVELAFANKNAVRAMLLDAAFGLSVEAFAGLGFDLSLVSFQLGIFGSIGADFNFLYLTRGDKTGERLDIDGEIGIRMKIKLLFISYSVTFASTGFNWWKTWDDYDQIQEMWKTQGYAQLFGVTEQGRNYTMMLYQDGTGMVAIEDGAEIENREYLALADRVWSGGADGLARLMEDAPAALTDVQENAYPYADPVFTQDGGLFVYISDNDTADKPQTTVSYAVRNGNGGYDDKGKVDPDDTLLADSDAVVSGSGSQVFAAWIRQSEAIRKEMETPTNYDDLGMMLNAAEIYSGVFDGSAWTVERLTDNDIADMSPAVASSGGRAVVAWRSLNASAMPKDDAENEYGQKITTMDLSAMFNVENSIRYRIYSGGQWTDAEVAYNGAAGTVNALDAAMLPGGEALLAYTVRTDSGDAASTETFYTLIGADGAVVTTARLTSDDTADTNVKAAALDNRFLLGWYSEHDAGVSAESGEKVLSRDIRLACVNDNGSVDPDFPESIGGGASSDITPDFRFSLPNGADSPDELSLVWCSRKESDDAEDSGKYQFNAIRYYNKGGVQGFTAPTALAETDKFFAVDHFDAYTDPDGAIHVLVQGSDYSQLRGYYPADPTNQDYQEAGLERYDSIGSHELKELGSDKNYKNDSAYYTMAILTPENDPISYIKLGVGSLPEIAVEASVAANLHELHPGLNLPVMFFVKNNGTEVIDSVTVSGGLSRTFDGLGLLPNETTVLVADYPVPADRVEDVSFTLTPAGGSGTELPLTLNRPDVGIAGMRVTRESDGTRDIRFTLKNLTGIPLAGSGKQVKLALYSDAARTKQVGETVTVEESRYGEIDRGVCMLTQTVNLSDFGADSLGSRRVYARAWVDGVEELYPDDNNASVRLQTLEAKTGTEFTLDASLAENGDGSYTVTGEIHNNKLQTTNATVLVRLLDSEGNVLAEKPLPEELQLTQEQKLTGLTVTFQASEFKGTPASAELVTAQKLYLDLGEFGSRVSFSQEDMAVIGQEEQRYQPNPWDPEWIETRTRYYITLGADGKPGTLPTPKWTSSWESEREFLGWFTRGTGYGKIATADTVFQGGDSVYATYRRDYEETYTYRADGASIIGLFVRGEDSYEDGSRLTLVKPTLEREGGLGSPEATYTGRILQKIVADPPVVYKKNGEVLSEAPTTAGTYTASFTLGDATATLEYTIEGHVEPISQTVTFKVANGKWDDGTTADKTVTLTGYEGDTLKLAADQIPAVGTKPNDTYKAGSWDVTPSTETEITADTTYTYTYAQKEAATVTKASEAKTLTYTGSAQSLVTAGTAAGGEMRYALGNATEATEPYTTSIPAGTDAGTYYVWYYVKGDENHTDTAPQCLTVEIGSKYFYAHSLTLNGDIGVNFYVCLTEEEAEKATVSFTWMKNGKEKTASVEMKNVEKNGSGYKAACFVSASDMDAEITATLAIDGVSVNETDKYSVADYAEVILTNSKFAENYIASENSDGRDGEQRLVDLRKLVSEMLVYGKNARAYFDTSADPVEPAPEASIPQKDYAITGNLPEGVRFDGATLSLRSKTSLSLYFVKENDGPNVELSMDGKTRGDDYEVEQNGNEYIIRIRNIAAAGLGDDFTVTVNGSATVTYSPMTYCYLAQASSNVKLVNIVKALYNYWSAAKKYYI